MGASYPQHPRRTITADGWRVPIEALSGKGRMASATAMPVNAAPPDRLEACLAAFPPAGRSPRARMTHRKAEGQERRNNR